MVDPGKKKNWNGNIIAKLYVGVYEQRSMRDYDQNHPSLKSPVSVKIHFQVFEVLARRL